MSGSRVLLTLGTFDTPHMGHAVFLQRLRRLAGEGGEVVVGINTDAFVAAYKGRPPMFTWEERAAMISQLGFQVIPNPSAGREVIRDVGPHILGIGTDWATRDYLAQIDVTQEELDAWGIILVFVAYRRIVSTSAILERGGVERD